MEHAIDSLARSVTGDGYDWYHTGRVRSPGFPCSLNFVLPCGWGAVSVLRALTSVPSETRSPAVARAIAAAADFLLAYDIALADYQHKLRISPNWFKFGYPTGYATDVLLNLEALIEAGRGAAPRLLPALDLVLSKQDSNGRWCMEHSFNGKMLADMEVKRESSKWVTLRALRALKGARKAGARPPSGEQQVEGTER